MDVPKFKELMNPTLDALRKAGGSASNGEIAEIVIEEQQLPESVTDLLHGKGPWTEVEYRLGWSRSYLKQYGLINNSTKGVWALTPKGVETRRVDPDRVVREVLNAKRRSSDEQVEDDGDDETPPDADEDDNWQERLIECVLEMSPDAFERLCARMLRESGFTEVTVTGKPGDGGIDGHGILRMGELISFPVVFQCKRFRNSVSAGDVRNFRGAIPALGHKGLFITTGNFTTGAKQEATKDGVSPIDLIDGTALAEKLKELELGVSTEMVEKVTVDPEWFGNI